MYITLGVICLLAGVSLYLYQQRSRVTEKIKQTTRQLTEERMSALGIKGLVLGPIQMIFIRYLGIPVASLLVSMIVWSFLLGLFIILVTVLSFDIGVSWAIYWLFVGVTAAVLTAIFIRPDKDFLKVPNNTVAPLTFIGTLYRLYLNEGDYKWWGQRFFIARSTIPLRDFTTRKKDEVKNTSGEVENPQEDGFFKRTKVPFTLFNEKPKEGNDGKEVVSSLIDGVTKGGSPAQAELLITLQTFDPHLALRNDDPGLEIAERARSMFRTCISFLNSVDTAVAKDLMAHLIEGKTIVVAFTLKAVDQLAEGSIVRDTGGEPTYFIVEPKDGESLKKATARTIREYKKHLAAHLTDLMRDAVTLEMEKTDSQGNKSKTKEYVIETRSVEVGLNEILEKNGFYLTSASVGKVVIDGKLSESAVSAELQTFENTVQVKSAKATAAALKELASTKEQMADPAYLDKVGIAAAADPGGKSQFNRVSTDNKLATVGVAAAVVNKQPMQATATETAKD